ncbi:MAG TPA: hypothetical protein PKH95_01685 [Candidatus Magasanikbacteria bacterium]|nr:hypothetical protein [Candidatus Magasanikbacteria bacterium]
MLNKILKDLFKLLRQTEGRGVLADSDNGDLYVILPATEYERLTAGTHHQIANLNEEEMLEKVNKEIAFWHSLQEERQKYEEFEEILRKNKEKNSIDKALERLVKEDRKRVENQVNFGQNQRKNAFGPGLVSLKDVLTTQDVFRRRDLKKEEFEQKLRKKIDPEQEFFANNFFQEEGLNDVPEEEERFYLEPVE